MKYLYVYHGVIHRSEARLSIISLRQHHYPADITVICPKNEELDLEFVKHINIEVTNTNKGFRYKVFGIFSFDAQHFTYIDTDTVVLGSLIGLQEANKIAGIAGVADPLQCSFHAMTSLEKPNGWRATTLPELNTGVLSINQAVLPKHFLAMWLANHDHLIGFNSTIDKGSVPDQPSLLATILDHQILPLYLGSSYNFRACYPQILYEPIVISHSHIHIGAAFRNNSPIKVRDIVITTPWGLNISRTSWVNRLLYFIKRKIYSAQIFFALKR